jgi:hypothetical protein
MTYPGDETNSISRISLRPARKSLGCLNKGEPDRLASRYSASLKIYPRTHENFVHLM